MKKEFVWRAVFSVKSVHDSQNSILKKSVNSIMMCVAKNNCMIYTKVNRKKRKHTQANAYTDAYTFCVQRILSKPISFTFIYQIVLNGQIDRCDCTVTLCVYGNTIEYKAFYYFAAFLWNDSILVVHYYYFISLCSNALYIIKQIEIVKLHLKLIEK